ncbi:hypothetical protein WKW79_29350 [Variovorax robiniae]|uniref:Uncharacterized protein n=1 Tax=Variovorax robiniae TaxID=1836199 RepID=A0ABU8XJ66_9BURK
MKQHLTAHLESMWLCRHDLMPREERGQIVNDNPRPSDHGAIGRIHLSFQG